MLIQRDIEESVTSSNHIGRIPLKIIRSPVSVRYLSVLVQIRTRYLPIM